MKPVVVYGNELAAMEESIRKAIAYRAYEIFQRRGNRHGGDLEDWLHAERELIKPSNIRIADSAGQISLRAEVPAGFSAQNIKVGVAAKRLVIWGEVSDGNRGILRMLGEIELPSAVDPKKTTANITGEVLEIRAVKEVPSAA